MRLRHSSGRIPRDDRRRRRLTAVPGVLLAGLLTLAAPGGAPSAQQQGPVFRAIREMVLVDVVVRDRSGQIVRGLTAADFEVVEDGRPQQVSTFSFQEINRNATPILSRELLADVDRGCSRAPRRPRQPDPRQAAGGSGSAGGTDPAKFSADELVGRRLIILLFDVSSMPPEDVQRSIDRRRSTSTSRCRRPT